MRWAVALLAATTLVFSAATFHFAHLLQLQRHHGAQPPPAAPAAPRQASVNPQIAAHAIDNGSAPKSAQEATGKSSSVRRPDPGQLAIAHAHLDQLHDPAMRSARAKPLTEMLREQWRPQARDLGLSAADIDRIAGVQAEQALQYQERQAKCQIDPACDIRTFGTAYHDAQEDRYAANLGPETYARFKAFQESWGERNAVYMLNMSLPDADALSGAAADRLAQILGEQRHQFARDAEVRGEKVEGFNGVIDSAAVAGSTDEYARRRESAGAYASHAVELASSILDAGQLARYREMLEGDLYEYSEYLQESAIRQTARPATGGQPPDAAHP